MTSRDQWAPGGRDGEGRATPSPATVERVVTTPPITYGDQHSPPRRQRAPKPGHYEWPARRRSHRSITDVPEARPIRTRIPRADRHRRKCHTQTRQRSVRWDHIRVRLYGASRRTAQRAVHDLLTAGVLEIVKPGFGNQYGPTCAPIYQIAPLVDNDTWVAQSNKVDDDKPGSGSRHPGVVLDGPIDGPIETVRIDGGASPQSGTSPDESQPSTDPPPQKPFTEQQAADPEPPRHMPIGTDDNPAARTPPARRLEEKNRRTTHRTTRHHR